jgi:hypothetical protein
MSNELVLEGYLFKKALAVDTNIRNFEGISKGGMAVKIQD